MPGSGLLGPMAVTIALELTGDPAAALDLLEQLTAAAHGYAVLHLSGFLRTRAPSVDEIAGKAAELARALATAARQRPPGPTP